MKVFIVWSGDSAQRVAELLHGWLPNVIQQIDPFLSAEDTEKGSIWFNELSERLGEYHFCIVCLTPNNLDAPWIHWEAGAIFKGLSDTRICTFLAGGLTPADVKDPLSRFQHTLPTKKDIRRLLGTMNSQLESGALDEKRLDAVLEKWWPEFESGHKEAEKPIADTGHAQSRGKDDILREVLALTRETNRAVTATTTRLRSAVEAGLWGAKPEAVASFRDEESRNRFVVVFNAEWNPKSLRAHGIGTNEARFTYTDDVPWRQFVEQAGGMVVRVSGPMR